MTAMKAWLVNSVMALICFGLWAFLPKISVKYINQKSALIYEVLGGVLVATVIWTTLSKALEYDIRGTIAALSTGIIGYLGMLFFLNAVKLGNVSVVASLTAVYPAVTIVLAIIFLKEKVNYIQYLGILLAIIGVTLLAYK